MSLMMAPPAGISAFPESDSDLTYWRGRLEGAEVRPSLALQNALKCADREDTTQGTFYQGHEYAISLKFPQEYPYKAPTVRFETTCFRAFQKATILGCLD